MNTRKMQVDPRTIDWRNANSIWDAHPSNHRLAPGGSEYEGRYLWVREQVPEGARVLDVGCNCGQLAVNLAGDLGCQMWGVDIVGDFVEHCKTLREKPFRHLYWGDFSRSGLQEMGYRESLFDVVTALELIEHPIHVRGFLENVRRVLRPGGRLLVTTPHPDSKGYGYKYLKDRPHHVRMWTPLRLALVFGPPYRYGTLTDGSGEVAQICAGWLKPFSDTRLTEADAWRWWKGVGES